MGKFAPLDPWNADSSTAARTREVRMADPNGTTGVPKPPMHWPPMPVPLQGMLVSQITENPSLLKVALAGVLWAPQGDCPGHVFVCARLSQQPLASFRQQSLSGCSVLPLKS